DSEQDFEEELELERLRQQAVRRIRENQGTDRVLNDLDIKIALLERNSITLEEVIKASRRHYRVVDDLELAHAMLKGLDKESRQRLEGYQQLFYLLQTHPPYLARLLTALRDGAPDRVKRVVETVVLTVFGFAQNPREEYLLLKLFKAAIAQEMEGIESPEEFLRSNPTFIKLAIHYQRGAKERKYLRDLLQPLVRYILEDPNLDLETDPLVIYRSLIREEESRTGVRSARTYDVTREDALADVDTRSRLIEHLKQLRALTDQFVEAIQSSLPYMPYGIRYLAKELKEAMLRKFPEEQETQVMKVVGNLVYYRYINPAIVAPESFDVIETLVSPGQRRKLAEVAKMLNQVSMGRLFDKDNLFLQPLNNYVAYTSEKFARYSHAVTEVPDAEQYFRMDEFQDFVTTSSKPTIYISPEEMFSLHAILETNLEQLVDGPGDPLRQVLIDLGPAPHLPESMEEGKGSEIALELSSHLAGKDQAGEVEGGESAGMKHLFFETKRSILYIIRIQSGPSLLDIMERPVTQWEEQEYAQLRMKESSRKATVPRPAAARQSLMNLTGITFAGLKQSAMESMKKLEDAGMITRENEYQEMVNAVVADIRNKHRRRIQRREELGTIRVTLVNLGEKSAYLDEQKEAYMDYIQGCMAQLSTKMKRSRALPFTKQYFHRRELEKLGRVPKFGSYKYTAERLHQKGVLLGVEGYSPR
ncbi:Rho GTPase activation protein, partial [Piptocephalis cylindrospora]